MCAVGSSRGSVEAYGSGTVLRWSDAYAGQQQRHTLVVRTGKCVITSHVAVQALEFWNTICEEELTIVEEQDPSVPCHNFMRAAAPHLVPILLEQLTKQEEGQEQDPSTWNLSVAAGMCLGSAAQVVGNDLVPLVSTSRAHDPSSHAGGWACRVADRAVLCSQQGSK